MVVLVKRAERVVLPVEPVEDAERGLVLYKVLIALEKVHSMDPKSFALLRLVRRAS